MNMKPRRLARELTFLCLMQSPELPKPQIDLAQMVRGVVGLLREECDEALQRASVEVEQSQTHVLDSEIRAKDLTQARTRLQEGITLTAQAINRLGSVLDLSDRIIMADQPEVQSFVYSLLKSYFAHQPQIDAQIADALVGWQLDRIGRIEHGLLRLSMTELVAYPEISPRIVISEAVELAKRYGGEQSSSFVNGVLRRVLDGAA